MNDSDATQVEAPVSEQTYAALKRDIAARLKNACSHWTPEDFEAIVEKITRTAIKYARPGSDSGRNR